MSAPGEGGPWRALHYYAGWANGAAHCKCGQTFDSVQELDRHIIAHVAGSK